MTVTTERPMVRRTREDVPKRAFSFHWENRDHDLFRVSVLGKGDRAPFVFDVRTWGNMVNSVRTFTECIGAVNDVSREMANVYRTGYAMVNGFNVRVIAVK